MAIFYDRKAEMDLKYPIDYNTLIKKGFSTIADFDIKVSVMHYSDGSHVLLIKETSTNSYDHYHILKRIVRDNILPELQVNILDYEIFEYQAGNDLWKVIFHNLSTSS